MIKSNSTLEVLTLLKKVLGIEFNDVEHGILLKDLCKFSKQGLVIIKEALESSIKE